MIHSINRDKMKQYTREEFDTMLSDADWCMRDGEKNESAECIILINAYDSGSNGEPLFYCMVFTSIEADAVTCVDCRDSLTYTEAINQAAEQMHEEHQY